MSLNQTSLPRPGYWLAMAVAVMTLPLLAACGPSAPTPADNVLITVSIAERATSLTREDLQVKQGDTVSIDFTADEAGEVHLHGYNLTAEVSPGQPGNLTFEATNAGAFGINFHVFATDEMADDHHHAAGEPGPVASETPMSIAITATADADGGVNVRIDTSGFRFAPELVDQAHRPGAGHAHIYVDGVKLGRVYEPDYHIADLAPGEREIRVSLNTNNHSPLMYNGRKLEATTTVSVPDVGQGHHGHGESGADPDDHGGHDHGNGREREVTVEVHLGNLEVHP